MAQPPPPPQGFGPGQNPTPQQIQQMQQQFFAEAARQGLTPQQFADKLRAQAMAQQQQQQQGAQAGGEQAEGQQGQSGQQQQHQHQHQHQQGQGQGQQVQIQPGPPRPEALALAKFLKGQDLKSRGCILQQERKELFKVKRALRALQSPAYAKARSKNPALPEVTDRASAESAFKMLPISMLALRVSKVDPKDNPAHGQPGHQHGAEKKVKGLWTVRIEQQQEAADEYHYVWFYEGSQWKQKLYAAGGLALLLAVVLFPLWPYTLRVGVWYLSMGMLGLLGLFFGMAIFRLILFLITIMAVPPGIWLYPNLFEDVGFFDSFKPLWAWRETKESLAAKKAAKKEKRQLKKEKLGQTTNGEATKSKKSKKSKVEAEGVDVQTTTNDPVAIAESAATTTTGVDSNGEVTERRNLHARVEEVEDE